MDAKAAHDPEHLIAIVGMSGRFPGAADASSLWDLLMNRAHAIGPVPAERWDTTRPLDPEKRVQAVGGFIEGVDEFDAGFFGVSPREAAAIDPQQRLMLEMGWRALEDAGMRAADLAGTRTGVYVGASWHDYELLRMQRGARPTPHSLFGNALDVIAARVSYFLKVRGPSLAVETGCSSSLVALHLAAQALRQGEIDSALVGGTNLMLDPHVTIGLTHFGGLSPDGRCATFTDGANGFVRGEGVAALYVKTLARALADGDRIHAVVVRTAVNNDGGGESLVTPSQDGQEDLLAQAYDRDELPLNAPTYIEAHGTGTGRGDPIEATALGRVLGRRRGRTAPLYVGSIKTNIGHLEASAGMAGLFKLILALKHGVVPPTVMHAERLNPQIAFDELGLSVVREPLALPADEPVYLGVNSFGWGGTNAHVVVTGPPAPQPVADPHAEQAPATGIPVVLPLSAQERPVLASRARQLSPLVPDSAAGLAELSGALAWRRDHFAARAAIVAAEPDAAPAALEALAASESDEAPQTPGLVTGRAVPHRRTAFVFPGQGSQWSGMGRELYRDSPHFAAVVHRCAEALRPHVEWDLLDAFTGASGEEWMSRIDMLQPTLWAMSLGLAELWRACGVQPDLVLGHSQGEITAATFAGILSYEDGAMIVARRSAIARRTSGYGRMLAVDLTREAALAALEGFEDSVSLAVHNGPSACVLSGEQDAVLMLKELLEAEGTYCRLVNVDYASHSPQMDPLREDLLAALSPARPRQGEIGLLSTVRVRPMDGPELDAGYWVDNLRSPVLFADAMTAAFDAGVTHVVEISPHPVLVPAIEQLAAARTDTPAVLATLRRDQGGTDQFALALGLAYVSGLEPFGALPRRGLIDVPGYPLRRDSYWIAARDDGNRAARGFDAPLEPAPGEPGVWHAHLELSVEDLPWLADHQVYGTAVLPAAAMLATAVNTAAARSGSAARRLHDVIFHKGIGLGDGAVRLAAHWRDRTAGHGSFRLMSLPRGGAEWELNASAAVDQLGRPVAAPRFPEWAAAAKPDEPAMFYNAWSRRGLAYGPAFRAIRSLRVRADVEADAEALGEVALDERLRLGERPGVLHPALWDGALQVALALCDDYAGTAALVPTVVRRIDLLGDPDKQVEELWSHAVRRADGLVDLRLFDLERQPLMVVEGLELRPLPGAEASDARELERLHGIEWDELEDLEFTFDDAARNPSDEPDLWLVCGPDEEAFAALLAEALQAAGTRAVSTGSVPESVSTATGIVFVAPSAERGIEKQQEHLSRLTSLVTVCTRSGGSPRLAIVTANAQAAVSGDLPDPGAALYWGYTRVLRREHSELAPRLIDVAAFDTAAAASCARELLGAEEDQIALRSGRRLAGRLTRGSREDDRAGALPPVRTKAQPFRLETLGAGADASRCYVPLTRRAPDADEIEVEVIAAYCETADPGLAAVTGYCGRVVATGRDSRHTLGDRVAAVALGLPASHITIRGDHAQPVPEHLDDAEAAVLPAAMTTAWYVLADLARVAEGESVLVDDSVGAGNLAVHQAAVQIAQNLGAHLVAADTDEAPLDSQPVDVVFSTLDAATDPRRLDVLADGGRHIALAGAPVSPGPAAISLDTFRRKGISFSTADLGALLRHRPQRFAAAFEAVWDLIAAGKLAPPRIRTMTFAQGESRPDDGASHAETCADPDQCASPEHHADPFVLVDPNTVTEPRPQPLPGGRFRSDGSYLITGGLGALGLSLAEHLADHGAGALVLAARSEPSAQTEARIAALRAGGTIVETARCDVADAAALRQCLDVLRADLPPLRGVVHAAGLLADATIENLTAAQIEQVLRPKVAGVRSVEMVTCDDPLDFFVLFSSAAALVGNAGQAAYSAANAYLDATAEARRARGLPALSVQWGPFTDIGLAATDERRGARLEERGMGGITADEAWPALLRMLDGRAPVVGYVPLDLRRWFDAYPDTAALDSWSRLLAASRDAAGGNATGSGGEFLNLLLAANDESRPALAEQKVRELAGRVLRLDPDRVERETPFKALGLDSLMSLELRNRLESAFAVKLSPTLLWAYGNSKALAGALCEQLAAAPVRT